MTIHIESLQINTIIGLLDFERITSQRVTIDLEASYEYREEDTFINYADFVQLIETQVQTQKYKLLEEALLDLKDKIITTYPRVKRLKIKILKPDILENCCVGVSQEWDI